MKLIMMKGLPASGKTTFAKQQKDSHRINKDDLRAMLHNSMWSKHNEKYVLEIRDMLVMHFLKCSTRDVIVDDTNLAPKHEEQLRKIADEFKVDFVVKDFTDVSLETCIERDIKRSNPVGEKVIRGMYNQFLKPKIPTITYNPDLLDCIICDLDGTLALFGDANPYDRDFVQDQINDPLYKILARCQDKDIIFMSGRQEKARAQTEEWLKLTGLHYAALHMRPTDDTRRDVIIKRELYEKHILGKYNVLAVFDDRLQVCKLWYELGLPLFRVGDPESNF